MAGTVDPTTDRFIDGEYVVFKGHLAGSVITIDELAPGYTDSGNKEGDIIVIKPTTLWADLLAAAIEAFGTDIFVGVPNEVPGGAINGSNVNFTTAEVYTTGALKVFKNGIRLMGGGQDYTEVSGGFTMVTAPVTGTRLLVDYDVNAKAKGDTGADSIVPGPQGDPGNDNVFIQVTQPTVTQPSLWVQTDIDGNIVTMWLLTESDNV